MRRLNNTHPVNWKHSLNRGRVLWLKALPQWPRGQTFHDLTRRLNGTITSTASWVGAKGLPGGFGAITFAGGYVDVPAGLMTVLMAASASMRMGSVATWFRPTNALSSYETLFDCGTGSTTRQMSAFLGGSADHLFVAWAAPGSTGTEFVNLTYPWTLHEWQRLMLTCDGTTLFLYRNGLLSGTTTSGIGSAFSDLQGVWRIGGNPSGGGQPYTGQQDDITVWARCLSAADARADYLLSRKAYRRQLNWIEPWRSAYSPVAVTGNRRRRLLLAAGGA